MASDVAELVHPNPEREELYKSMCEMLKAITEKDQTTAGREGSSKQAIPSIYMVPSKLREQKQSSYTPRVLSIGPLHRDVQSLKDMENHKFRYMHSLFRRTSCLRRTKGQPEPDQAFLIMGKCVDSMLNLVEEARTCYERRFRAYSDGEFAQMMLVDGCFIIELVYRSKLWQKIIGDPILGNALVLDDIRHDLLLLENQIPFFVLERLFKHTVVEFQDEYSRISLSQFILDFFGNMMNFRRPLLTKREESSDCHHDHILGLLHHCYLPRFSSKKLNDIEANKSHEMEREDEYRPKYITKSGICADDTVIILKDQQINYSATALDRAGVNFHALKTDLLNVDFSISCWFSFVCGKRTFEIPTCYVYAPTRSSLSSTSCFVPWLCRCCGINRFEITPLCLYNTTESFLRNLIAYEQCKTGVKQLITSYVYLMHTIINTKEDVDLLVKAKVLENNLGTREDVLNLFNHVCKEVIMDKFLFALPWKFVHKHCKTYRRRNLPSVVKRNCASFTRFYFSSRWAFVSVSAALILFVLQVMQTVYTIRSPK